MFNFIYLSLIFIYLGIIILIILYLCKFNYRHYDDIEKYDKNKYRDEPRIINYGDEIAILGENEFKYVFLFGIPEKNYMNYSYSRFFNSESSGLSRLYGNDCPNFVPDAAIIKIFPIDYIPNKPNNKIGNPVSSGDLVQIWHNNKRYYTKRIKSYSDPYIEWTTEPINPQGIELTNTIPENKSFLRNGQAGNFRILGINISAGIYFCSKRKGLCRISGDPFTIKNQCSIPCCSYICFKDGKYFCDDTPCNSIKGSTQDIPIPKCCDSKEGCKGCDYFCQNHSCQNGFCMLDKDCKQDNKNVFKI